MALKLYDTLARDKRLFEPRDPARVTLYVCGPTVWSYAHIGNARPVVVFDVLFRLLRRLYGAAAVVYARNVTDVDDKINAAAAAEGVEIGVIADRYLAAYEADMGALNALTPTAQPRATAYMRQMVVLIERLLDDGGAYVADGEVLFDVAGYDAGSGRYGALAKRSLDEMIAGARVEVAPNKRHPADFVLWKPSKPGEPAWPGPRGLSGRPGWHIECSAMSEAVLGLPIDIHGGGHDLIFPHHSNEIAQSCAAHGAASPDAYARYWVHNGFLTLDAEKMSKSLGNVKTVHELAATVPGEVIRWALLSAHYRAPLDWTQDLLERSRSVLDRLYGVLQDADRLLAGADAGGELGGGPGREEDGPIDAGVLAALGDDLNTPEAAARLFALADGLRAAVTGRDRGEAARARARLADAAGLMGFLQSAPDAWFRGDADDALAAKVEALIAARAQARQAKDWPAADRIRDDLAALNVEVLDGAGGAVSWRLKG